MAVESYDYVIVGAGSAGCVLASRLTEDPEVSVLLVEAGPRDLSIFIHMPAALAYPLANDRFNWAYWSEPEPHMNERRMYCPRGRVLGGSSSINGMAYVRGHALDYERWAEEAGPEWSYSAVLPYFRRAETRERGGDAYRGDSGPLRVSTGACENPLFKAWMAAGEEAGYAVTADMNGFQQEGLGPMDMTVSRGRRCSASKAFLGPARKRPNLSLKLQSLVLGLGFDGRRARRLVLADKGGRQEIVAEREIILAAGAINSPQLLLLSGIGPAEELRALGMDVRQDLPGVGRNLQDHLECYVQHAATKPVTLYGADRFFSKMKIGAEWLFLRKGIGATSHFEAGGFIRSAAGVRHPDLQYHFLPVAMNYDGSNPAEGHGFQAHVGPMRPTSNGAVTLRSTDPRDPPTIRFNYMATEQDRREMRDGIKLTREIFAQTAFDELRGPELAPGPAVQSDEEIDAFVRAHGESAYHPSCTCAMGEGPDAVVDSQGRVHGLEGLRVVDASIMPSIVSGNLNAPTIMMAEKLADAIRGQTPLPPSNAGWHEAPDWKTSQR